jgi:hypothetical protein
VRNEGSEGVKEMKGMKGMRCLRGLGLAVLILLAGGGAYGLEDLPLVNTQTLSLAGMEDLAISYGHDELILRESETGELVIKEYMSRDHSRYYARVSRAGGALRIRRGRRPWLGWNWKARAEIYLPRSFRGNLRIANASGNLSADMDLSGYKTVDVTVNSGKALFKDIAGGTVSVRVNSGELELRALEGSSFVSVSSGRLRISRMAGEEHRLKVSSGGLRIGGLEGRAVLELTSGSIAVDRVRGGVEARVSSGLLELDDIVGPGSFEVSSGNLRMNLTELPEDLCFRLSSGDIELGIPLEIPINLDVTASSGNLRVYEGGTEILRVSGNSTVLRPLGTGAERTIQARISSGNLTINRR